MKSIFRTRMARHAAQAACLFVLVMHAAGSHGWQHHGAQASSPEQPGAPLRYPSANGHTLLASQVHLPDWLDQHRNLPIAQQELLLRRDPTFSQLAPQTQSRLLEQLHHVDALAPARRERYLARNEALERLTPTERAAFNQSMQQMTALPPDRRALVQQAFRQLRTFPMAQREARLNSEHYTTIFSPEERGMLLNLLGVEPYLPDQKASTH